MNGSNIHPTHAVLPMGKEGTEAFKTGLASQARHKMAAPNETFASRNVVEPATSRVGTGCSTTELRLQMAEAITCIHRPII